MKNYAFFSILILFVLMLTLVKTRPTPNAGVEVFGADVFNTQPFECGQEKRMGWVNEGDTIRIYQSQVWMGMFKGDVADLSFQVNIEHNILHRGNWDHYTDPTGIQDQIQLMNWTPNYVELKNGEKIDLIYGCYNKGVAQIVVTIWYAK